MKISKRLFLILAIGALPLYLMAQVPAKSKAWEPLLFLIGEWRGEGIADSTSGEYTRSYQFVLGNRFIEVKNRSVFPPSAQNSQGEIHEDHGFLSYDKSDKKFIMRQFHIEGFVNQYRLDSISPDGLKIVFITEAIENIPAGWKAKESYEVISNDEFIETFELAAPGKAFEVYSKVRLKRVVPQQ